jgi:hypothetical protein
MCSLMSQGKSSSFIGLPLDLFVEESGKRFQKRRTVQSPPPEGRSCHRRKDGVEKQLPLDQTRKFSVFEREMITLDVGDRIRYHEKRQTPRAKVPQ